MDYSKGGRFFIHDDEKKKPVPQAAGVLNPREKEETDNVFNGKDDNDNPPF
jgi:hypothetical protein